MKTVKEFLKEAVDFQEFASTRGLQLLMAEGCRKNMYKTPDEISFEENGVFMMFREAAAHFSSDLEEITLSISMLEKTQEEWDEFISNTILEREQKEAEMLKKRQAAERAEKERQLEKLKQELGINT